jgi:uncharacterized coiled-coil DUF342 family protein
MKKRIYLVLFALLSTATIVTSQEINRNDNYLKDKKLDLLERLERGEKITSEDISSSFGNHRHENFELPDICIPDMPVLADLPPFPDMQVPDFYFDYDKLEPFDKSYLNFPEFMDSLNENLEALKEEVQSFRNSDEFKDYMEEVKKEREEMIKGMQEMREKILKSIHDGITGQDKTIRN